MIDLAALIVSIALLAAYQYFLEQRQKRDALFTVHAVNIMARNAWVEMVMSGDKPDVLAVQTLRNSVMASSFMASTAILLLVGTLTLSGSSSEQAASTLHALNPGETGHSITAWKLILLLGDFFIAFFCFSMAVRFYNHVGYMISIPVKRGSAVSPGLVAAYLNRAGLFYLLGLRSFFYSVPLVFWMFGPHFMVVATVLLIAALYPLDRAPRSVISSPDLHRSIRDGSSTQG
jgi:uncharacterized membrane protein